MRTMILLFSLVMPLGSWAAVPRSLSPVVVQRDKLIQDAMRLPFENRIQALKTQGPGTWNRIQDLAFDRSQNLELRWRALTVLPYLDKHSGKMAVEKALAGDEWYLRNAAALALPAFDRSYALDMSAKLLSDPALVIRTAAAQNMLKLQGREKESLLWEKLNSAENFRKGQSLWVRRHIARALAEVAKPGTEGKFVALLSDADTRLYPAAIRALERLTGLATPSKLQRSPKAQRTHWVSWWNQRQP